MATPWARVRWLAQRCGLDATAIWEWGVLERVTSGLWCTRIDLQPLGRQMLIVADRLVTREPWRAQDQKGWYPRKEAAPGLGLERAKVERAKGRAKGIEPS